MSEQSGRESDEQVPEDAGVTDVGVSDDEGSSFEPEEDPETDRD